MEHNRTVCPFCKSSHIEQHFYTLSSDSWWLCRECSKLWEDKNNTSKKHWTEEKEATT